MEYNHEDDAAGIVMFDRATSVVGSLADALDSVGYREDIAMPSAHVRQAGPFLTTLLSAAADANDSSVEHARPQLRTLLELCT